MPGMCSKCGQKVSGEGTGCTAMDKLFHIKCFVCVKCGEQFLLDYVIPLTSESVILSLSAFFSCLQLCSNDLLLCNCFNFQPSYYLPSDKCSHWFVWCNQFNGLYHTLLSLFFCCMVSIASICLVFVSVSWLSRLTSFWLIMADF